MTRMHVTAETLSEEGLFWLREVEIDNQPEKQVKTPTAVHLPDKRRGPEGVHPENRGVAELYKQVRGDELDKATMSDQNPVEDALAGQVDGVKDEEIRVTITSYQESSTMDAAHAKELAKAHAEVGDIAATPLVPNLVKNIREENSNPSYQSLKTSIVSFLNHVHEIAPNHPVLGVLPVVEWKYLEDLLEMYSTHEHKVQGYLVDFDRRTITQELQEQLIQPLMHHIGNTGIEEYTLCYALNLPPGLPTGSDSIQPSMDMISLGLGFDIIGGRHRSAKIAGDVEPNAETFRLFKPELWAREDISFDQLAEVLPNDTGFGVRRVVSRSESSPLQDRYRLEQLVNLERKAIAAANLREELREGKGYKNSIVKRGVTDQAQDAFDTIRDQFDEGRFQTSLEDF